MELMFGIKKVFDPNLILNPGKVSYELGKEEERNAAVPALAGGAASAPAADTITVTKEPNETLNQSAAGVAQAAANVAQAAARVAQAAAGVAQAAIRR